jgi:hypothetical protein
MFAVGADISRNPLCILIQLTLRPATHEALVTVGG